MNREEPSHNACSKVIVCFLTFKKRRSMKRAARKALRTLALRKRPPATRTRSARPRTLCARTRTRQSSQCDRNVPPCRSLARHSERKPTGKRARARTKRRFSHEGNQRTPGEGNEPSSRAHLARSARSKWVVTQSRGIDFYSRKFAIRTRLSLARFARPAAPAAQPTRPLRAPPALFRAKRGSVLRHRHTAGSRGPAEGR